MFSLFSFSTTMSAELLMPFLIVTALSTRRTRLELRKGELLCRITSPFTIQVSIEFSRCRYFTGPFCLRTFRPICDSTSDIRNFSNPISCRYFESESPSNLCYHVHRSPWRTPYRPIDDCSESNRSCRRSFSLPPQRQTNPPRIPFRMLSRIHSVLTTPTTS